MDLDYKNLGMRIKEQRMLQNLTQEQVAKNVGISISFFGHIERGARKASLDTFVSIANVLNISTDYLLANSLKNANPPRNQNPPVTVPRYIAKELSRFIEANWDDWSKGSNDEPK